MAGVQRMDIEEDPLQDRRAFARMEDVHMEALDLGVDDDDVDASNIPRCLRRSVLTTSWRQRRLQQWKLRTRVR